MNKKFVIKFLILSLTSVESFMGCKLNIPNSSEQSSNQTSSNNVISSEQISSNLSNNIVQSSSNESVSSQDSSSEHILSSEVSSEVSTNISSQTSSSIDSTIEEPYSNFVSVMDNYVEDSTDTLDPDNGGLIESEVQTIIDTISTYYASVDTSYKGETLWTTLYNTTVPTKGLVSYGELRYATKGNPYAEYVNGDKTKIVDFYTGAFINSEWDGGNTWNREHVWCTSHSWWSAPSNSTKAASSDLHHLRPSDSGINSSRSNSLYGEVPNRDTYKKTKKLNGTSYIYGYLNGGLHSDGVFEPTDRMKGDVARIIMYLLIRYKNLATPVTNIIYTPERTSISAYQLLVKWHNEDPVSNFEIRRNQRTYEVQGNRNPFIDVPSYANAIFANI